MGVIDGARARHARDSERPGAIPTGSPRAVEILRRCELFQDLGRHHLAEIGKIAEAWPIQTDELLLQAGDRARYLYVIDFGHGVAQLELERGRLSLGLVGPGDSAGWTSLIDGQVYPGSVRALTPMGALRLATKDLALLMGLNRAIGYLVHRRLSALFCRQYCATLEAFRARA